MARQELAAPVIDHRRAGLEQFELILQAPLIAEQAQPGQFVQVRATDSLDPFLRRPYAVYRTNPDLGHFSVLYNLRGPFTRLLAERQVGDCVRVLGPLGRGFVVAEASHHVMVSGGFGAPPVFFLALQLARRVGAERVTVINGARSRELLVGSEGLETVGVTVHTCTEDGTEGEAGSVTDRLLSLLDPGAAVYACGPHEMLRVVSDTANAARVPCQVSVDSPLPCGLGVCYGCPVRVREEGGERYRRACTDGPVFDAEAVVWE